MENETTEQKFEYHQLKAGVPTICGLQAIKGMVRIAGYHGPSKFHQNQIVNEPDTYGFQFVYRAFKDSHAFVNEKLNATAGEKGKLYRRVQGMCPTALGKISKTEMADMLTHLVNRWFLVSVKHSPMKNGGIWQDVVSVAALPPDLCPVMTPHEYFESLGGPKVPPADNSTEGYLKTFLATQAVYDGKPIPQKGDAKFQSEAPAKTIAGFEEMPDRGLVEHWYDIMQVQPHMYEKAENLLKQFGGVQPIPTQLSVWKTIGDVPKLEKYKIDAPPTQSDFDADALGEGF